MLRSMRALVSDSTRNVSNNGLAGCVIKIANKTISLAEVNPRTNTVVLPSGETCTVTCKNGFLSIVTPHELDIAIESAIPANGIHIVTGGNIQLSSMGPSLKPRNGLHLTGKKVTLNVAVQTHGIMHLNATDSVVMNRPVSAPDLSITAPQIFTKAKVFTNKLAMTGKLLRQADNSKFAINSSVLLRDSSPLDLTDPAQKAFSDARAELTARTRVEFVTKVLKTWSEKTWWEVLKGQVVPIVKEEVRWEETRSVIDMNEVVLKGGITGKKLDINAKSKLVAASSVIVDDLRINTAFLYSKMKSIINGVRRLEINGGGRVLVLGAIVADNIKMQMNHCATVFTGYICGSETLLMNIAYGNIVAFGGRIWGMNVIPYSGFYLNLLGWVAAHNFVLDTFFPADLGLHTPYIPTTWREFNQLSNQTKVLVALKTVFNYIYKPFGVCFRALLKVGTLVRNLRKIGDIIQETRKNYDADKMPSNVTLVLLALKDIFFAVSAMQDVRAVYEAGFRMPPNTPKDLAEAKTVVEENWRDILLRATPAFMPAYVVDCWRGIRAGWTYTGCETMTHIEMHDKYNYSRNLGI